MTQCIGLYRTLYTALRVLYVAVSGYFPVHRSAYSHAIQSGLATLRRVGQPIGPWPDTRQVTEVIDWIPVC